MAAPLTGCVVVTFAAPAAAAASPRKRDADRGVGERRQVELLRVLGSDLVVAVPTEHLVHRRLRIILNGNAAHLTFISLNIQHFISNHVDMYLHRCAIQNQFTSEHNDNE